MRVRVAAFAAIALWSVAIVAAQTSDHRRRARQDDEEGGTGQSGHGQGRRIRRVGGRAHARRHDEAGRHGRRELLGHATSATTRRSSPRTSLAKIDAVQKLVATDPVDAAAAVAAIKEVGAHLPRLPHGLPLAGHQSELHPQAGIDRRLLIASPRGFLPSAASASSPAQDLRGAFVSPRSTRLEASMRPRLPIAAVALVALLTMPVSAQDAKGVIAAATKAMGAGSLDSMSLLRVGRQLHLRTVEHRERAVAARQPQRLSARHRFPAAGSRATAVTLAPPVQGGPPTQGMFQQNITPAQTAWAQQLEIWITPWGFLKGAAANDATVSTQGAGAGSTARRDVDGAGQVARRSAVSARRLHQRHHESRGPRRHVGRESDLRRPAGGDALLARIATTTA